VEREGGRLRMSFPSRPPVPQEIPEALTRGLRRRPIELLAADDYMAVFDSEATVRSLAPDQTLLGRLDLRGIIATAPGAEVDFVSRFFVPQFGIAEDPVTGSAHCELAPYWAERLGKNVLTARQVSKRGGDIECEVKAERVFSSGVRSCSWKARSLSQRPWSRAEGEREDSIVGSGAEVRSVRLGAL
jgi:predicted PhzF superfamily epimerase YddE/YHI9